MQQNTERTDLRLSVRAAKSGLFAALDWRFYKTSFATSNSMFDVGVETVGRESTVGHFFVTDRAPDDLLDVWQGLRSKKLKSVWSTHSLIMAKFVPRERKHRRLEKLKPKGGDGDHVTPNSESHVRATESEKDERRRKLKNELTAHAPDSKIIGKKKKRLDK